MKLITKMVMVMMEMLPRTPRWSGDVNGVNFPFTRGSAAVGSALSRSRRGFFSYGTA
jgi:hypothetical protein